MITGTLSPLATTMEESYGSDICPCEDCLQSNLGSGVSGQSDIIPSLQPGTRLGMVDPSPKKRLPSLVVFILVERCLLLQREAMPNMLVEALNCL